MEIGKFPLRIRYGTHEPAYSVLNRFALRHRLDSISGLVSQIGRLPKNFARAVTAGQHIKIVAGITLVPELELNRNTLFVTCGTGAAYDHFLCRTTKVSLRRGRVCRACLADDLDLRSGDEVARPHRRFWWDVGVIGNCPVHASPLTSHCPACQAALVSKTLSPRMCGCGFDLASRSGSNLSRDILTADAYFLARLTNQSNCRNPILDPMPFSVACLLINYVARLAAENGGNVRPMGILTFDAWPYNFHRILDTMMDSSLAKDRRGIAPHYGSLNRWLSHTHEPTLDIVRKAIKQHASSRFSASQAANLFPTILITQDRLNLIELARRCGVTPLTAKRILVYLGITVADQMIARIDCTTQQFDCVSAWIDDHVSFKGAANLLVASPHEVIRVKS